MYPSLDETKLLVVSYELLTADPPVPGYSGTIKLYAFDGLGWNEVVLPSSLGSFVTADGIPQIKFTPNLDSIMVFYAGGVVTMRNNFCYAANINYATRITVTPYLIPIIFDTISVLSKVNLYEAYLHLIKIDGSGIS